MFLINFYFIKIFKIFKKNSVQDSKLMFSVERFDYTKGIKEKLLAYRRYFEKYPQRIGKDVLFQVFLKF